MRLLLIRHGETDRNAGQLALGQDDVPLNERGRGQAQALAKGLLSSGHVSRDIVAVYSSPLDRAVATATPLAAALGLDIEMEPSFIEMDIGEVEGVAFPEMEKRYPDFLRVWMSDEVADARMPGGECLREVQERAWSTLGKVREHHPDDVVVVLSHNFVILTLLCKVLDLPLSRFRRLRQDLAAVSVVELTDERQTLLVLNDRSHLA